MLQKVVADCQIFETLLKMQEFAQDVEDAEGFGSIAISVKGCERLLNTVNDVKYVKDR